MYRITRYHGYGYSNLRAASGRFLENWLTQSRKGLFELLIIRLLAGGDSYGYELSETARTALGLNISDGTLYAILTRLTKAGAIKPYLRESASGPARKYYRLTAEGRTLLLEMEDAWRRTVLSMEQATEAEPCE
ncbi:MAG: PadR family transcriptional regulator [Alphaproteobacteria bacterium]|nr:PadR family transcriptional regulator [Alphaproteobacteria bacterium]